MFAQDTDRLAYLERDAEVSNLSERVAQLTQDLIATREALDGAGDSLRYAVLLLKNHANNAHLIGIDDPVTRHVICITQHAIETALRRLVEDGWKP